MPETLPRPRLGDDVAAFQQTVIGVAGGFVLEAAQPRHRALVHYDFRRPTCTLHELDESHSVESMALLPRPPLRRRTARRHRVPGLWQSTSARPARRPRARRGRSPPSSAPRPERCRAPRRIGGSTARPTSPGSIPMAGPSRSTPAQACCAIAMHRAGSCRSVS